MKRVLFFIFLCCLAVSPLNAQKPDKATHSGKLLDGKGKVSKDAVSKAGMDPERLARIPARMKEFVDSGTIAGAVTLVARHGVVASLEAVGYQDLESKKPMRTDTIFNIASMTKSLTAVGIMILLEEGRLLLSDPVEKHLPEFRGQMMVERRDGYKVVATKKPSRPITIRDLLTHTSGMTGDGAPRDPSLPRVLEGKTLAERVQISSQKPLEFEPGTKYHYSSPGFATLGQIIESVTGQPYEQFVEQYIVRPLGMKDTFFFPPPEKCDRIASGYDLEDGKLRRCQSPLFDLCRKRGNGNYGSSAGGWLSTASDIFAFYQMMLNGGIYKGSRILSRASVEVMTTVHTGDLPASGSLPTPSGPTSRPELGSGLGWRIIREPLAPDALALESIGSYGHGGRSGTIAWVDPKKDLVGVFLIQRHFGSTHRAGHGPERETFMAMAAAAIADDIKSTTKVSKAGIDRKSTRLNSSHIQKSRMPSSA